MKTKLIQSFNEIISIRDSVLPYYTNNSNTNQLTLEVVNEVVCLQTCWHYNIIDYCIPPKSPKQTNKQISLHIVDGNVDRTGYVDSKDPPVETELAVQGVLDVFRLAEPVLFPLVDLEADRDSFGKEGLVHFLRLVGRNDFVLVALEQEDRAVEGVDAFNWTPFLIDFFFFRVHTHEAVEISGLELVRVLGEEGQIRDPIQGASRLEDVSEGEGSQRCVPTGGTPVDAELFSIGQALFDEVLRPVANIVDVDDAPALAEPAAVISSVTGGTPIIDVQDGKAARCPVLNARVEGGPGGSGGAASSRYVLL